jgi:hypothetical protein
MPVITAAGRYVIIFKSRLCEYVVIAIVWIMTLMNERLDCEAALEFAYCLTWSRQTGIIVHSTDAPS